MIRLQTFAIIITDKDTLGLSRMEPTYLETLTYIHTRTQKHTYIRVLTLVWICVYKHLMAKQTCFEATFSFI